jgi:hypothetical protein
MMMEGKLQKVDTLTARTNSNSGETWVDIDWGVKFQSGEWSGTSGWGVDVKIDPMPRDTLLTITTGQPWIKSPHIGDQSFNNNGEGKAGTYPQPPFSLTGQLKIGKGTLPKIFICLEGKLQKEDGTSSLLKLFAEVVAAKR